MYIKNIRNFQQDSRVDGITYGYIRVSTIAQHDDRQRIAMEDFGIAADHIFADKQSGKDFDRPAYNELMARLSPNDTLVVKSLDRLGRRYASLWLLILLSVRNFISYGELHETNRGLIHYSHLKF